MRLKPLPFHSILGHHCYFFSVTFPFSSSFSEAASRITSFPPFISSTFSSTSNRIGTNVPIPRLFHSSFLSSSRFFFPLRFWLFAIFKSIVTRLTNRFQLRSIVILNARNPFNSSALFAPLFLFPRQREQPGLLRFYSSLFSSFFSPIPKLETENRTRFKQWPSQPPLVSPFFPSTSPPSSRFLLFLLEFSWISQTEVGSKLSLNFVIPNAIIRSSATVTASSRLFRPLFLSSFSVATPTVLLHFPLALFIPSFQLRTRESYWLSAAARVATQPLLVSSFFLSTLLLCPSPVHDFSGCSGSPPPPFLNFHGLFTASCNKTSKLFRSGGSMSISMHVPS